MSIEYLNTPPSRYRYIIRQKYPLKRKHFNKVLYRKILKTIIFVFIIGKNSYLVKQEFLRKTSF